jgi:hypothetical protein
VSRVLTVDTRHEEAANQRLKHYWARLGAGSVKALLSPILLWFGGFNPF